MSTINQTQDELVEEFGLFEDWADKYEYLIDLGKKLLPMSESFKTEENVIKGCQSKVWLHAEKQGDLVVFQAEKKKVKQILIILMMKRLLKFKILLWLKSKLN
jgi:cysteine desulfuration protein SufE